MSRIQSPAFGAEIFDLTMKGLETGLRVGDIATYGFLSCGADEDAAEVMGRDRMGADAGTTLNTEVALKFGNKVVDKGKYVLRAKLVAKDQWHLIVQKLADKAVVAEVPLTYQKADNSVEELTITLEKQGAGGKFTLQWGKLSISTDFQKG